MFGAISTTAFIFALSGYVTGATSIALAAFVVLKNPRNEVNRSWAYFCTAVSIWGFFGAGMGIAQNPEEALFWLKISHIGVPMIAPTFYHFTLNFTGTGKPKRAGLIAAYMVGLLFVAGNFSTSLYFKEGILVLSSFYWGRGGPLYIWMLLWWISLVTYAHVLLYKHLRICSANRKRQIRLIFWGTAIGYLGGSTGHLIVLGIHMYPFGNWTIPLYTIMATYAIIRYKAMDIQTVIHKTLLWAALSSLVLIPLYVTLKWSRPWLENLPTWEVSLFALGLFYFITLYYRTIQPRIDHLFQRRKYDLQQVLDQLLGRLAVLGNIKDLSLQITQTLKQTLYTDQVVLLLRDEKTPYFRSVEKTGERLEIGLSSDDLFLEWIRQHPMVIEAEALEDDPAYADVRTAARSYFERTGAMACVPLSTGHEFVGFLNLGPKTNLKPYNELDLQLLEKLRVEAAIALSNASLYDRVMRLNAELSELNSQLEAKVRERTTELEAANQKLTDSNQKIAEADRAKTQFLANISHELRTPLNAILGFSKILLKGTDGPLTDRQREDLQAIHHSGAHLLGLISDLLDLSKIEAGKMDLITESVDLKEVIRGVMTTAQALVKDKPLELRTEVHPALPLIDGDPMRLRQVILNLISNAVKFTDRGEVTVHAEQRGAYLIVSVRDTGPGIRPEDQEKLFEEFRQLNGGQKGGTGLGLAISKKLVQLHGGEIWVDSLPGEGCTFAFSLPVKTKAAMSA